MTSATTTCRSCHAPIAWGESATGKRTPYDVVDGHPTTISHFTTCPDAKTWSRNGTASTTPTAPASLATDRTALRLRIVELAAATIGQFAQARGGPHRAHPAARRSPARVGRAALAATRRAGAALSRDATVVLIQALPDRRT